MIALESRLQCMAFSAFLFLRPLPHRNSLARTDITKICFVSTLFFQMMIFLLVSLSFTLFNENMCR